MGYVYEPDTYKLIFEGKYAGLEIIAIELSLNALLNFSEMMWIDPRQTDARQRTISRTEFMLAHIERWNLEDAPGQPTPLTVESLLSKGKNLHTEIMSAWLKEVVGLRAPLVTENESSQDGSASSEDDLSMIPMSPIGELPEQN